MTTKPKVQIALTKNDSIARKYEDEFKKDGIDSVEITNGTH